MPPVDKIGYWGSPTSTIDWCETNYEYSYYIAEFTNTLSNLVIILLPLWGMLEVVRRSFEKKFIWCFFLVAVVGVGSWAFHMTLQYQMQLFDELPMVWGTCVLVYCLTEVPKPLKRGTISNVPLFSALTTYAILFTIWYLYWPVPVLQHTSFAALLLTSFGLGIQLIKTSRCKICKRIFIYSTSIYVFGFFLWILDKVFCSSLQNIRGSIPAVFNPVTQLHGWWHCFAGYGTYLQILFTIHASYDFHPSEKSKYSELRPTFMALSLRWVDNVKRIAKTR